VVMKLAQTPKQRQKQCTHPNLEWSDLSKARERRRRAEAKKKIAQADKKISRWTKLANAARSTLQTWGEAMMYYLKAKEQERLIDGTRFEEKVADDTKAKSTSIKFKCPDCGLAGDIDVLTADGVVKECKSPGSAASPEQFAKIETVAPLIFGAGTVAHFAVPAGDAGAVEAKYPGDKEMAKKIQEH
jgi:hypothetical protein